MKLELSDAQRLILFNQYLILERLDSENADSYVRAQKALEGGYEAHYADAAPWLADRDLLSVEESREAASIMSMFSALKRSYEELADKSGIKNDFMITFTGFDGNNEAKLLGYARFVVHDQARFQDLLPGGNDFNSHAPLLGSYRAMLSKWKSLEESFRMTKEQIISVISAATEGREGTQ